MKVPDTGSIGLEGDRGQMEYRRIRILELPSLAMGVEFSVLRSDYSSPCSASRSALMPSSTTFFPSGDSQVIS